LCKGAKSKAVWFYLLLHLWLPYLKKLPPCTTCPTASIHPYFYNTQFFIKVVRFFSNPILWLAIGRFLLT
jgi:hypothetical protein